MDPVIVAALRLLLALLFANAAFHKLADFTAFRIVLHDYEVLPRPLLRAAAVAVVAIELLLAATLPWSVTSGPAALGAIGMLTIYSFGIGVNLARGRRLLECGCAPSAYRQPLSVWLLWRNLGLATVAAALLLPSAERVLHWLDAVTLVGLVVAVAVSWVAGQRLLSVGARVAAEGGEA